MISKLHFCQIPDNRGRGSLARGGGHGGPGGGGHLQQRTNGHNSGPGMDIIDTSIRVGQSGTGSREKLHPKQDYDEEAVIVFLSNFYGRTNKSH